jgi:hypothetical protein
MRIQMYLLHLCRSISVDMFQKAMDLDLRWHLMRKTGEVTRIMDRGTSAIQQVLSTGDGLTSPMAFTPSAAESLRDCTCFSAQRCSTSGLCRELCREGSEVAGRVSCHQSTFQNALCCKHALNTCSM